MPIQLQPLCSIPKAVTREGHAGANAYFNGPGDLGIWYANGQVVSGLTDRGPQDNSRTYQGSWKPDTFTKGFSCNVPASSPFA